MPSTTAWAWKFLVLDLGQKVGQFYGNGKSSMAFLIVKNGKVKGIQIPG